MAQYNANLDIVRELLVSTLVVTENYVTGPSVKDETSTMDYVFIGDHEECRNSKMEVTDYEERFNRNRIYFGQKWFYEWIGEGHNWWIQFLD